MDLSQYTDPIETLKKATRNIRDGNLDFEVEIGDDDEIGELCADFEEMRIRLKESTRKKWSLTVRIRAYQ